MLTILGLGPGDPNLLTREAWDVLTRASTVHLRTRKHPTVGGLPTHLTLHDFDAVYESGDDFAQVYARIVDAVIAAAQQADVVYAVPGHPLVGEATVPALLQRARDLGIETRLVSGLSFIEPVLESLQQSVVSSQKSVVSDQPSASATTANPKSKIQNPKSFDPLDGLQLCDALELAALHHPPLNPDRPALVAQVYSRAIASDVKLTLMNQYPPEHLVAIVGSQDQMTRWHGDKAPDRRSPCHRVTWSPLHQLDHLDCFDHLTTLYVPATPIITSFEGLQETIAYLRAPNGCPWDREQTHESLRSSLLEEMYEVLAALDEGNLGELVEELGDVLMNVIMQAQIATEAEEFRMVNVIAGIDAKLKRRHPHVFGDTVVNSVGDVLTNWNAIKQQEHADKGAARESALDGIPPALPALAQAQKMAHKAERVGFQWSKDPAEATQLRLAKVHEEVDEAVAADDNAHRQEEIGDLLFTLADLADGFGIDAETALREANLKFSRRFRALESLVRERGLDMQTMALPEIDALWDEVKKQQAGS